ncbi:MogA/MoaB family molybdenum cofactor biosynthesis protein [Paenibacillus lentus]|uniref:Molybdenum cofactor biosynthesis protein B n=1 Tax=Paenibacillus lentus TaxID=1338368 RepID=A0A3S8RXT2_9BACL|nr:MogA/MoaB family molybdenum cofactor biosynthesis protein [Paenibacillus lentus]AZK47703.1 MogA/MoaB family molybdenum cofactor biosynthesis protein [Paenibacillus lentus]
MRSVEEHRNEAPDHVSCMIVTVSDTRTAENDTSGKLIRQLLEENGYKVMKYTIIKDDYDSIRQLLREAASDRGIEAVLLSGGTGISPRDTTYEAVRSLLNKEMPGFGEIFRYLSFTEDIGSAAILSRAIAGTISNMAVFSMPGSQGAVKLAMERIIIPELKHIMREINKK